jgi:predicted DNA-binding transcriptional regulator AlpA
MGLLQSLLKRAQKYRVKRVYEIDEITDPIARKLFNNLLDPASIITPEEVAARLKVPESWVDEKTRARCRNPMPVLRLGRYIRFDWSAVINWLKEETEREKNAKRANLPKKR